MEKYIVYFKDEETVMGTVRLYHTLPQTPQAFAEAKSGGKLICVGVSLRVARKKVIHHSLATECLVSASLN